MDARELLAWNLRRLRVEQDVSQERLAIDAGVDRTYVSRLERKLENPSIGILEKLASTLGTNLAGFFVEPDRETKPPRPLRSGRKPKN